MTMLATAENVRVVDALVRRDFVSFIAKTFHTLMPNAALQMNWHIYALAYHLELVRLGIIRRLIINLPRRFLKSITASAAFPAYVLGRDPTKRLLAISYDLELAATHATPFRTVVNSPWYQPLASISWCMLTSPAAFAWPTLDTIQGPSKTGSSGW